jgi:tetratricopeptide (TPR) repeat protein
MAKTTAATRPRVRRPAGQPGLVPVQVRVEQVVIPTYEPAPPDRNPMFLEKRVYQGSSGKVYPLPFTDRIAETKTDRRWQAIWLENEYLRVMILPEIGGRIHVAQDKTNGYDFIYRQQVIKPALVGLAGPWISGGIEFNWPQHHRPATFMPVDYAIEAGPDGSQTVWLGDHDPMARMKGMHGVCLRPGQAVLEVKVRAYNRTALTQTFLWWANVAARVHEGYQSFFPPDVTHVADHAKRAMSAYPRCHGHYYGIDYGSRARDGVPRAERPATHVPPHCGGQAPVEYAPDDLGWYANIPTPCSYMAMGSSQDFFGGYDHLKKAGLVHIANHHISPGKKQWTWGNHEFGYAWDRNLTDADGPYIELMAGVYTDNHPDFSFLQPGETKTWSQYWYPIQKIGPATHANREAALHLSADQQTVRIGVSVSQVFKNARIILLRGQSQLWQQRQTLAPGQALVKTCPLPQGAAVAELRLRVETADGTEIIAYQPVPRQDAPVPQPATEPPSPAKVGSADELYVTGLHLEQYRHATRCPTLYWREALRRDPQDARCNNALGRWHLQRGEWAPAEAHFRTAIARLTLRNPNPADGEPHYHLGLCLRFQLDRLARGTTADPRFEEAYAAFYKAAWNQAWQGAAYHALAELDCRRSDWATALDHLNRALRWNTDNLRARNLKAMVLGRLGQVETARALARETAQLDRLDQWSSWQLQEPLTNDLQVWLDLAFDLARAGFYSEAAELLQEAPSTGTPGTAPILAYTLGWLREKQGKSTLAAHHYSAGAQASPDYCFPSRLEEILVLESALRANSRDARAHYYLGNLLYDRRRHPEAIRAWEKSVAADPANAIAWRNLGIGYFNVLHKPQKARQAYERAFALNPQDARLLYERDQLWKRLGVAPARRLHALEQHRHLVAARDDLTVELCALYNRTGRHPQALARLAGRKFQPWEGGEGLALGQHTHTHLALGRLALKDRKPVAARDHFAAALEAPKNLGEARHVLGNHSDIHYWLGEACAAAGDPGAARCHWMAAAHFKGDFQEMSVRAYSEMTYYAALAWTRLRQPRRGQRLLQELQAYARQLRRKQAQIDYFATSLPTLLLFNEDLQQRQAITADFLEAQACLGLGRKQKGLGLLRQVLQKDPNHAAAADLLTRQQ